MSETKEPESQRSEQTMIDRAQATIRLIAAATELAKQVTGTHLAQMPTECARLIVFVKARVDDYKSTSKPKDSVFDGDDTFHGCG